MRQSYEGFQVVVHPRIERLHGVSEEDMLHAWENSLPLKRRNEPRNNQGNEEYVTIGFDAMGKNRGDRRSALRARTVLADLPWSSTCDAWFCF